jgi:hypothetical protein
MHILSPSRIGFEVCDRHHEAAITGPENGQLVRICQGKTDDELKYTVPAASGGGRAEAVFKRAK